MTRVLAILVFVLAGVPGLGVGVLGALAPHQCESSGCHVVAVEASCCSQSIETVYCPMSGGPCECATASLPEPRPRPDPPQPGPERDQIVAAPRPAVRPIPILPTVARLPCVRAARLSLLAGMTHNDIQAFLGTWRT